MRMNLVTVLLTVLLAGCSLIPAMKPERPQIPDTTTPLAWGDVLAMPMPAAGQRLRYGPAEQQFGELSLPDGRGRHPVVVLLHGGCWLNQFDLSYFRHWADWLRQRGFAVWNLEYRRIGDAGGRWPGTLADVADGIDHLQTLAESYPLDLRQVRVMGHSAGGHLALWAATRARLPASSPLYRPQPLPLQQVIGLAAITDLAAYRAQPGSCNAAVDELLGGSPTGVPERYAQASPRMRLPLGVEQVLVTGEVDSIVSAASVQAYADAARDSGDRARIWTLPGAGHFDTGVPTPSSAAAVARALSVAADIP